MDRTIYINVLLKDNMIVAWHISPNKRTMPHDYYKDFIYANKSMKNCDETYKVQGISIEFIDDDTIESTIINNHIFEVIAKDFFKYMGNTPRTFWKSCLLNERKRIKMNRNKIIEEYQIKIENSRDKNLYMQGYEKGLKDANLEKTFNKGYIYGIQVENENIIRNLEEYLYELKEKRQNGEIVIGYWQVKKIIESIIKDFKL